MVMVTVTVQINLAQVCHWVYNLCTLAEVLTRLKIIPLMEAAARINNIFNIKN
jgi:hypothetical protein